MKKTVLKYNILIEKEVQDDGSIMYISHAPTLGIADCGKTPDLAAKNIEGAIKLYIESLQDEGLPVPQQDHEETFISRRSIEFDTPIQEFNFM